MNCVIVIPARMGSTRFPGKPLVDLNGKPMVQWVWERAIQTGISDRVLIATPDKEIVDACHGFGAEAVLTSSDHPTGTDRIAEVARNIRAEVYVNVQGDEPLIDPASIRACAETLLNNPEHQVGSLMEICPPEEYDSPSTVKVVVDLDNVSLYFSRHAIPYPRNERPTPVYKHVGLYAYRYEPLTEFATWKPTNLEVAESLEQLRFLEHGYRFKMARAKGSMLAIDEPGHVETVRRLLNAESSS
jgi:3-deoxy-manno-octulosonate cytidylyltransferase (CMP-KDO synthetase)